MASRQRDFQRSKVYAWERKQLPAIHGEVLSLPECVGVASNLYGARVRVKDGRGCRSAYAYHHRYPTIGLPKWARNGVVICHEVAHLKLRTVPDLPAHGARFMRTYIELLAIQGWGDRESLTASARAFGLKVGA